VPVTIVRALVVTTALLLVAGCGDRNASRIERSEDAGAGVVIVKRTTGGVRLEVEVPPNDESGAAMSVPVPGGVTGHLDGAADVDRYRVTLAEPGWLSVVVEGIEGVDLVVEVAGADGVVVAHCDNGPALVSEGIPNVALDAGAHDVIVREFTNKKATPREGESPPYQLTIRPVPEPTDAREREPNDEPDQARPVLLGGEVQGYVGWRRDVDYWSVPTDDLGDDDALDIDIDGEPGVELHVDVLRGVDKLATRDGARGQALAVRGLRPGAGSDEPLLVAITGRRSSFDEPYAMRVNKRQLRFDEEAEPNDAIATATPLAVEPGSPAGARTGTLTPGDVDVYAVPVAPARQSLSVTVEPRSPSLDVVVSVIASTGDALAEADAADKGGVEKLDGVGVVPNARAYVRVARKAGKDDGADDIAAAYSLRWSLVGDDVIPRNMLE
jgi:hypothetical protein